jgi:Fe-Mn family superoxide dismutase
MRHAESPEVTPNTDAPIDRREALATFARTGLLAGAAVGLAAPAHAQFGNSGTVNSPAPRTDPFADAFDAAKGEYALPKLPYETKALEPHIDAATMDTHHAKHHAAYVSGANRALRELQSIREGGDAGLIRHWARELAFNVGGHVNHTLFWHMMAPPSKGGGGEPSGTLMEQIKKDFGSYDKFVAHFKGNAIQIEGNGWGWLVLEPVSRKLLWLGMQGQQDRILMGARPILGIDVWEHAYYLKYQNRRSEYVDAFTKVINWKFCEQLFDAATK